MPPAGKRGSISVVFDDLVLFEFEAVTLPDPDLVILPDAEAAPELDPLFVVETPEAEESVFGGELVLELEPSRLKECQARQYDLTEQFWRIFGALTGVISPEEIVWRPWPRRRKRREQEQS
ncbi:hypothetical protein GP486_006256 [Trichoglossum hirsutum]|uniref:Uncharacterized protein n=1 Tax=Trichoglossum hirsutum TaxID=265104 RepID=A0A9P8L7H8_9PEZI|nr:hypothetical protein GP486_006256 [Trichoglossum hirsutum]